MAFCRWYDKQFEDVSEHEQEQCEENGKEEELLGRFAAKMIKIQRFS